MVLRLGYSESQERIRMAYSAQDYDLYPYPLSQQGLLHLATPEKQQNEFFIGIIHSIVRLDLAMGKYLGFLALVSGCVKCYAMKVKPLNG